MTILVGKPTHGLTCSFEQTSSEPKYSYDREVYTNTLLGVHLDGEQVDILTSLDLTLDDDVYVVWVDWDEGDSNGWDRGISHESLAVFKTREAATEFAEFIENDASKASNLEFRQGKTSLKTSDGQEFEIPSVLPWLGHMMSLRDIHVQQIQITPSRKPGSRIKFS